MIVEVLPFKPNNVMPPHNPVDGGQYQIRVDGVLAGFIGYHQGARPLLHERWSPMELVEIEAAVKEQLPDQNTGGIRQVPLKPQPPEQKPVDHGDFD